MALLFVGGVMNLAWVAALAIVVAIEKLAPRGERLALLLGLCLRAAAETVVDDGVLAHIASCFGVDGGETQRYADPRRGQQRALRLAAHDAVLDAFLLAGDTSAAVWVLALLRGRGVASGLARAVLGGRAQPPRAPAPRSAQVCNCLDVDAATIDSSLASYRGDTRACLAWLQQELRCGTQCGSCLPAVRALVQRHAASAHEATASTA